MKNLKSINDTHLYKTYNQTLDLNGKVMSIVREGKILNEEDLAEYITAIDRRYNFPLKHKVVDDFRSGRVTVAFLNKLPKLPNTIPCFLVNTGKSIRCVVNVSNYATINKQGIIDIDTKILYSLLQGGTILATCYQKYPALKNKVNIIKYGTDIYAKLFSKVINKMLSLNITPAKNDVIVFLSGMFFIQSVLGRDEESLEEINMRYALENCKVTSKLVVDDIISKFNFQKDLKDLDTFIKAMAEKVPGFESLNTAAFTNQYIQSYGPNMLMALEYLPSFIHNMGCVMVGSYLNNQNVIENAARKEIGALMSEFATL